MEDRQPSHDREWQIQEAEGHLNQVLESARLHGPQIITHGGYPTEIVISCEEHKQFTRLRSPVSLFRR
jgi:prevent-host-death family protein